jgi:hypothetical protein
MSFTEGKDFLHITLKVQFVKGKAGKLEYTPIKK